MANKIQKLFMNKKEKQLVNAIENSSIQHFFNDDLKEMFQTTKYTIEKRGLKVYSTHRWHIAQGDDFQLVIINDGVLPNLPGEYISQDDDLSQKFAKKIFKHMEQGYLKQITR